jgi:hypothetical protein
MLFFRKLGGKTNAIATRKTRKDIYIKGIRQIPMTCSIIFTSRWIKICPIRSVIPATATSIRISIIIVNKRERRIFLGVTGFP